ncbi:COG4-domain-containing protein [Coniochaeta ligniaria NRRL 30616]|uniref:Conserved oligomeric Golgi complex subunit 4 n=1 Tax=Coniochaeta ligniaria NRRL 30616 TaxID=1408157 RepID=A0A1J7J5S0_9PEZI|nr:COG4-domain-containing protein [Coniochaeta ligniaria NRRL 30616]
MNTTLNLKSTTTPDSQQNDDPAAPLRNATSLSEILAALGALHVRESALTDHLDTLLSSHSTLSRSLGRLDNLRATLGSQAIAARTISSSMLSAASETASHLSGRVRRLDLEKQRVQDTLDVVEQVAELKACVAGVVGSMGAPQDWEAAAGYVARAAKVPEHIVKGGFAAAVVPTVEVPDPPWVTLEEARESLCMLFLREFEKAVDDNDGARVTRFFKLFPLIGRGDVGLDVYGRYVCQGVAGQARAVLREGSNAVGAQQSKKDGFFYANALTKLFEHVARIVDGHGGLVERHYGRKMVRVIERLQMEADVQGGIILDSWSDDRGVDRTLTDIKSYPFSFLVQSFLPQQRALTGTSRVNSPALGAQTNDARSSEDEGVNMKEVDGLLSEIAVMLGKWSLYSRFLASKCRDPETPEDAPLTVPEVLTKSTLHDKVSGKLISPYNSMTTFFFRRSVEKAFQLEESPSGLSLSMAKPIDSNPPFIMSAVDDVMYIVNAVIKKSLSTAQRDVVASVIPAVGRVLGSDFVAMIQRKMRDESYPKAAVQGGFPPEDKIISFIVLINSLDMANEYLARIVSTYLGPSSSSNSHQQNGHSHAFSPKDSFPFDHDAAFVTQLLQTLNTSFTAKTTELLNSALQVLYNQVIKPRLRPVLSDTFRDADYTLTEEDISSLLASAEGGNPSDDERLAPLLDNIIPDRDSDPDSSEQRLSRVAARFERGWDALMRPVARLMTPRTFASVLDVTAAYLARVLEKRAWSYGASSGPSGGGGGGVSAYGAIRMERDFLGIVGVVSKGGNYAVREAFAKMTQMLTVANMEEEEWEEINDGQGEEDGGMQWVLSEEERRRARNLVRS